MADGDIDYSGYSNAELQEALSGIDRDKFPRNFQKLVETIRARKESGITDRQSAPVDYRVRFVQTSMTRVPDNSFGLAWRGRLLIDGDEIRLDGKDHGMFVRHRLSFAFRFAEVIGVQRTGRIFRLFFRRNGNVSYATIATDPNQAEEIFRRLPQDRDSSGLAPAGEVADFERRLAEISKRTPVTFALIGINVVVFVAMVASGVNPVSPDGIGHVDWGSNLVPITVEGQWWRLATSIFLHFGVVHLAVNMWVLYGQGQLSERLFGSTRFLILYLLSGLTGSMLSAAWHPAVNSAGASGAIFGIFGGLLAFLMASRNRLPARVIQSNRASLLVFVIYSIGYGLTHPGIDNAAHVGGLVMGFLLGLALARPVDVEVRASARPIRVAGIGAMGAAFLVVAAFGVLQVKNNLIGKQRFDANSMWFSYHEARLGQAYIAKAELLVAGKLTTVEMADWIKGEFAHIYVEAFRRLNKDVSRDLNDGDPRHLLLSYVILKREALVMLEKGMRSGDQKLVDEAVAVAARAQEKSELYKQALAKDANQGKP